MANRVRPGLAGPRLHHHALDELFWVLDGELAFQLGTSSACAARASSPSPPAGWRTRSPTTPTPARTLIVCTPAGFERHFARTPRIRRGSRARLGHGADPPVTTVGPQIG